MCRMRRGKTDQDAFRGELIIMEDLLTIEEVAGYFRVSKSTIQRWIKKGQFPEPDVTVGDSPSNKTIRWKKSVVENYTGTRNKES